VSINRDSPIPYYVQVTERLREHIEQGMWRTGEQLPGELELCRTFGVSRPVIRQAFERLMDQGLIVRRKGKGTFVAEPKIREGLFQKLTGFFQDMVDQGYEVVTQVLKQHTIPASAKVASKLEVAIATPVIELERLRFVQGEPLNLVISYLPHALCPRLIDEDLSRRSLYAFLEDQCGLVISRGRRTLEAVAAGEREANLLLIDRGAPLIVLDSVSYLSDGTPVEYYYAYHRGDRSRFDVELVRVREPRDAGEALGHEVAKLPRSNTLSKSK
jgi:GntR family transcriptional regulator